MTFLAPWMLAGLAAASIPVVLHLFFRSRYRTIPWAAMKFLLTSVEQTSRRLKFQELLLLIVRTALLLFLALALARPSTTAAAGSGGGDAVDAVLIIDTSFSMGAREGSATRLDRAKGAATSVIDHLPPHSTAQVVASADRALFLGPTAGSNLELAKGVVQSVELSHLATDFLPAFQEALAVLARGHSPNKEIYLFSDMQRLGWYAQADALVGKVREAVKKASVTLVRCGTRAPRNVSIVDIAPQSGVPHTGERAGFAVLVRNSGLEPVRDLTVTLEVEDRARDRESQPIALLAPGETQAVTLTGRLEKAGLRVLAASVTHDELEADNRFHRVLHVRQQARVLVVDGAPSEARPETAASFYLLHSLRPVPEGAWSSYHVQPRLVTTADASAALLSGMDLCVLANVALQPPGENNPGALSAEFVERLAGFVREGHGLIIFGGPRVSSDLYNKILVETHDLLPYRLGTPGIATAASPLLLEPGAADPKSFLAAFREEPLKTDQTTVLQWHNLEEKGSPDAAVPLRYANGRAAVATRKVGSGEVIFVTTSADMKWTDWPLRQTYLPMIHAAVAHLLGGQAGSFNRTAGWPLRWAPPPHDARKVHVGFDPQNRPTRLGAAEMIEGRPIVSWPQPVRAGIYKVMPEVAGAAPGAESGGVFAVTPDLRESEDLESLPDKDIDERLGVPVAHVLAGEGAGAFSGGERLKQEWTLYVLTAVLLLVAFETIFAWYCGRGW